jgi:hypothetical protein
VVNWHPSVKGHAVRAAHYSFVWLHVWRSALKNLERKLHATHGSATHLKNSNSADEIIISMPTLEEVSRVTESELKKLSGKEEDLPPPMYVSDISDGISCFTEYEPRAKRSWSISSLVVSGLKLPEGWVGWKIDNIDRLVDPNLIVAANAKGYLDQKNMVYGNSESGVLVLKITVKKMGRVFLCESPGVWGKLPADFGHIWDSNVDIKVEPLQKKKSFINFGGDNKPYPFNPVREDLHDSNVCVKSADQLPAGSYNLRIKSKTSKYIMLGNVLVP